MKIDLVYTYVNGNDIKFIEKKNSYLSNDLKKDNSDIRYNDINEISYSVKTALKFLPWINTIYIVTDSQIPDIDKNLIESKKVQIVDHKDIIPNDKLPVFYSDVIESYLHNIPDLSEVFIYNNDDFLFFDYVYEDDIFEVDPNTNEIKLKIINNINFSHISNYKCEYFTRLNNTKKILEDIGCKNLVNNHYSKVLRKSNLKEIEIKYSYFLDNLRKYKFRNKVTIQYLFFVINIDNKNNNNIIITDLSNCEEHYFGERNYVETFKDIFKFRRHKFVCYNSMNHTYKKAFYSLMDEVLSS